MCKVTLSYDENNKLAEQQLAVLLSSGLFTLETTNEEDEDLLLPEDKEFYTPEELRDVLIKDLRDIYELKDAI